MNACTPTEDDPRLGRVDGVEGSPQPACELRTGASRDSLPSIATIYTNKRKIFEPSKDSVLNCVCFYSSARGERLGKA